MDYILKEIYAVVDDDGWLSYYLEVDNQYWLFDLDAMTVVPDLPPNAESVLPSHLKNKTILKCYSGGESSCFELSDGKFFSIDNDFNPFRPHGGGYQTYFDVSQEDFEEFLKDEEDYGVKELSFPTQ